LGGSEAQAARAISNTTTTNESGRKSKDIQGV